MRFGKSNELKKRIKKEEKSMKLTDLDLVNVSGGADKSDAELLDEIRNTYPIAVQRNLCPVCQKVTELDSVHTPWHLDGKTVEGYACDNCHAHYKYIS